MNLSRCLYNPFLSTPSPLVQNVITDKNLKLSDHIYIVFIINAHSILKSLSMDLCATFTLKKSANEILFLGA